jgi:dihydroflavonol-4-reductase
MRLLLPNCLSVETNLQALHAAAVFALVAPGQTSAIMDASIKGAEVALRAAADARVRKVVMTSLTVTLPLTEEGAPPVDESHWTADLQVPYFHAKTKGERLAWQLAADLGLDLVTVLPAGTTGPDSRDDATVLGDQRTSSCRQPVLSLLCRPHSRGWP